jgi:hypothetical protein
VQVLGDGAMALKFLVKFIHAVHRARIFVAPFVLFSEQALDDIGDTVSPEQARITITAGIAIAGNQASYNACVDCPNRHIRSPSAHSGHCALIVAGR